MYKNGYIVYQKRSRYPHGYFLEFQYNTLPCGASELRVERTGFKCDGLRRFLPSRKVRDTLRDMTANSIARAMVSSFFMGWGKNAEENIKLSWE